MNTPAPPGGVSRNDFANQGDFTERTGISTLTADEFKAAFRRHPGGVALITAAGADRDVAFTVTSVSSVSADPPLLVFSVSDVSSSAPTVGAAATVVVHFLDADGLSLALLGATSGIDRFADNSLWSRLPTGEPAFRNTRWLRCRVVTRLDAGTATLVLAQPVQTNINSADSRQREGLVYHDRCWYRLGAYSKIG